MSEFVDRTMLAPPTATRLADAMVADNLIYRTVDDHDRRRVLVHATRRGRSLHDRLATQVEAAAEQIVPAVPAEAVMRFLRTFAEP